MKELIIDMEKIEMITSASTRARYADDSRMYDIEVRGSIFDRKIELGINWSACGTRDPKETLEFSVHLAKASSMVKEINKLNAVKNYTTEPLYSSKEEHDREYKKVYEMVRTYKINELIEWLKDGSEEK